MEINLLILFLAMLADRYFGDPDWLWAKIPHPVVVFGKAIDFADKRFNKSANSDYERRRNGVVTMLSLLGMAAVVGFFVHLALQTISPFGELIEALIVAVFLAQKSLGDHVTRVAVALREEGIVGARKAVSMIVGRDPEVLDDAAVSRAAIESLAENTSDGIIAPAFWYALFGLPGLLTYKMLNTADSMIGHMNDRHRDFGRFAAKLDDLANWIPARLTGLLISAAAWILHGYDAALRSFNVMMRDARLHRSPNAGWPEAAMAGAIEVALAGPRVYGGVIANEPMLNGAGRRDAGAENIEDALDIFSVATATFTAFIFLLFVVGLLF
ncbi:adenosylcobinamide-phosphate synthase [Phyllobacterium brassicacearum]|uniref:Cobalamin biosynthesis protein CobD n=1 Tax=Phyllobacterium brassicacearum TaxID=314235 RepID=A0A2P7BTR5_9HYPH|nr:adenosylcobinamide-phosphate synthase CbiB [Phyllobacterium brassicacearum]PSH69802.1 adenosylcobinamide-phosphate synthase [Phyllobacterium brassicacearum]TDQ34959.1 adenosylcobinamide-phosphate synthase [Phyllobacterium brassicacearum]